MEFLRADYGSGSEEEGEVEEVKKGNSEQFEQDPIVGYSKGDRVIYMNSEECIVIEKHMVLLALFTSCSDFTYINIYV